LGDHQTQDQLGHPLKQGSNMKKLSLAAALLGAVVSYISATNPASAVLHGVCAGCVGQNIGGNDVTVLGPGGVTGFGFSSSPAGATGDLQLKILIPNTFTLQQVSTFAEQVSVTGAGGTGDIVLFNGGQQFTGGFLEEFLGNFNTSPKNPLGAFIDATNAVLPTDATGYFVLTADMVSSRWAGRTIRSVRSRWTGSVLGFSFVWIGARADGAASRGLHIAGAD
jgi:hypothetical protein